MSYLSLARKYRPQSFADLIGQEALSKALESAIAQNRLPQALLLTGIRGVGKTTTARIYAKSLVCEKGPTIAPCQTCENCQALTKGYHEDVLEVDGASNTGVDDVRSLIESIDYAPQRSPFKIYIIDEVHMLSQNAFNALLKTLEEPPSHVFFIFATTELDKVPQTIVSRCQLFRLSKFAVSNIVSRLEYILKKENIDYEAAALSLIAREGNGSLRDALTILDQIILLGDGSVKLAIVENFTNKLSNQKCLNFIDAALNKDVTTIINTVTEWDKESVDYLGLVEHLGTLCRHSFILKHHTLSNQEAQLFGLTDDDIKQIQKLVAEQPETDLHRLFRTLVRCQKNLSGSYVDRFVFENFMLEWCFDPGFQPTAAAVKSATNPAASVSQTNQQMNTQPQATTKVISSEASKKKINDYKQSLKSPSLKAADPQTSTEAPRTENKPASTIEPTFPNSWKELVDHFKKLRPLEARNLEEVYALHYDENKIDLFVDKDTLSAKWILNSAIQEKLKNFLKRNFAFSGILSIEQGHKTDMQSDSQISTIAEDKSVAKSKEKQDMIESAKNAPITQDVLSSFGGTIQEIQTPD